MAATDSRALRVVHELRRPINRPLFLQAVAACAVLLLNACGSGGSSSSAMNSTLIPNASATRVSLTGVLHGGQAPIVGSSLGLYAAGVPATADTKLLGTSTTDANGSFNIPYICPPASTLVYIVAAGGNSGGGANSAIKLMAALGPCGSLPSSIVINELTTVAAVYALNAFSNIASSGTGLGGCVDCVPVVQADMTLLHGNPPAINNAFKTAALLADVTTGQPAQSLPPAASCTVAGPPVNCSALRKLTALANVLGSCVNSAGVSSAQCTGMFDCAVPNATESAVGALDCTVPAGSNVSSDTLQATLSIARNQGVVGLTVLAALAGRNVLFSPGSLELGNEATIALNFTGGGLNIPSGIAIDSAGNVWTSNSGNSSVSELNSSGLPVSPSTGFTGGGLDSPDAIAIDAAGNVWIANFLSPNGFGGVTELSASGTPISGSSGFTGLWAANPAAIAVDAGGNIWSVNGDGNGDVNELSPQGIILSGSGFTDSFTHSGIAIDGAGNAWTTNLFGIGNSVSDSVSELNSGGLSVSPAAGFTGGGLNRPSGIAIDSAGNVWTANSGNNSVSELASSGLPLSPTAGFTGGGLNLPRGIAIDGADHIWVTNFGNSSVTELNSSGTGLSPFGFTGIGAANSAPVVDNPIAIAVDGAGDVWVANHGNNTVTEFIGAAAPTVTPLVAQITKPTAALVSIAVTPASAAVTDGSTQQFTATGTYADESTKNLSASVTWTSSNTSFATIVAGGLATCAAPGAVDITASITQDGTTITGTATQALICSAPIVSGPACNAAPTNPGGAQPYDNQSYCITFTGVTDMSYQFTGTLTFTTPSTPGAVTGCSYWSSGTVSGAGSFTTPQTACTGVINASAGTPLLNLLGTSGNSFSITFANGSEILGSYSFTDFGPQAAAGGDASGQIPATSPAAATAAAGLHRTR